MCNTINSTTINNSLQSPVHVHARILVTVYTCTYTYISIYMYISIHMHTYMYLTIDLISSSYPKENNRSASSTTRSFNVSLISSVYGEEELGNQHYIYMYMY